MDVIEWDSDKWIIETDGTNQNDGKYKENGFDRLEVVELTELMEFME